MEKVILENFIKDGISMREMARTLNSTYPTIRYYMNKYGLVSNWARMEPFEIDSLKKLCEKHNSISDILREIGLHVSNTNFLSIKRFAKKNNIILPKNGNKNGNKKYPKKSNEEVFCLNSQTARSVIRRKLVKEGLGLLCELCNQGINWNGGKLSMILDHINGIPDDNRRENLRFICPNCDSTLDTFCGRNKNNVSVA